MLSSSAPLNGDEGELISFDGVVGIDPVASGIPVSHVAPSVTPLGAPATPRAPTDPALPRDAVSDPTAKGTNEIKQDPESLPVFCFTMLVDNTMSMDICKVKGTYVAKDITGDDEKKVKGVFSAFGDVAVAGTPIVDPSRRTVANHIITNALEKLESTQKLPEHTSGLSLFGTDVADVIGTRLNRHCPVCGNPQFGCYPMADGSKCSLPITTEPYQYTVPADKDSVIPRTVCGYRCVQCATDVNEFIVKDAELSKDRRLDHKTFKDDFVKRSKTFEKDYTKFTSKTARHGTNLGNVAAYMASIVGGMTYLKYGDGTKRPVIHIPVLITDSEETVTTVRSQLTELMKVQSAFGKNTVFPLITLLIGDEQSYFKSISNALHVVKTTSDIDSAISFLCSSIVEAFAYTNPVAIVNDTKDKQWIAVRANGSKFTANPGETVTVLSRPHESSLSFTIKDEVVSVHQIQQTIAQARASARTSVSEATRAQQTSSNYSNIRA